MGDKVTRLWNKCITMLQHSKLNDNRLSYKQPSQMCVNALQFQIVKYSKQFDVLIPLDLNLISFCHEMQWQQLVHMKIRNNVSD